MQGLRLSQGDISDVSQSCSRHSLESYAWNQLRYILHMHAQAHKQVGNRRQPGSLLHRIQAAVEEGPGGPVHRLAHLLAKRIIWEAGCAAPADGNQLVEGVPGVRIGPNAEEVAAGGRSMAD